MRTVPQQFRCENVLVARPRAVVVDDHEASRALLSQVLESECDVVGQGANGYDAIALVEALQPDVIVLDVSMPVMGGFEAARQIVRGWDAVVIIFASQHDDPFYREEAYRIGARGYIRKGGAAETELLDVVRRVPGISSRL